MEVLKQVLGVDVAQKELVVSLGKTYSDFSLEIYAHKVFKNTENGMSGDYLLAIEEGSTIVRVGSSIFGAR